MSTIPNPASAEAIAQGCTCDPEQNHHGDKAKVGHWWMLKPDCPVHGGVQNLMAFAEQQKGQRRRKN